MKAICLVDYNMSVHGGIEQVTASLANALADYCEVHVLSLTGNNSPVYSFDKRVHFVSLAKENVRLLKMQKCCFAELKQYLKKHNISVVITQGHYPAFVVAPLNLFAQIKLIFSDHGALMNQWNEKSTVAVRYFASVLSNKLVTLTEQSRNAYIQKFLVPRRKIRCIYNWIDLDIPRSQQYDSQSKRIVSAGRFGKEKGFDQLVKAFAPVAKKHPDWQLDLFGDGEMMPVVKQLIAELGLENNVNLLGMRSDLAQRYQDYAMYVLPSYREGMPLVLLEAKANRLPIVSFDVMTGPREIVRDGVDGILVPPYDLEKMADAMCKLIENDDLRQNMAERSQENLDKFSKPAILEQWRMLIEEL